MPPLRYRYRGYYFDSETGLYYLNARYYDPETGRFISADDNLEGGLNLYCYCGNNPVNLSDYTGNMPKWIGALANPEYNAFVAQCFEDHVEGGFAIYEKNGQYKFGNTSSSKSIDSWDGPDPNEISWMKSLGYSLAGILHVHPFDLTLNSVYFGFSQKDINAGSFYGTPIYCHTAGGALLEYNKGKSPFVDFNYMAGLHRDPLLDGFLNDNNISEDQLKDFLGKSNSYNPHNPNNNMNWPYSNWNSEFSKNLLKK